MSNTGAPQQGVIVGEAAPGFHLRDQHGRAVTLDSLTGDSHILLYFMRDFR